MDCMEYMRTVPDKYFDLAIVDPPYGIGDKKLTSGGTWGKKYTAGDAAWDKVPSDEYFNELFRISKKQIIWGGNYFRLPPSRGFLIWDKVAHIPTMSDCEFAWTSIDTNAKIFKYLRGGTNELRIHICQKPVKLYQWILQNYAKPEFKILDTHLGSGSSAIAAHYFGVAEFVGTELDEDYYKACCERFENATAQEALF